MPFKFKDLIVTVLPDRISTGDGSGGCGGCSDAGSASVGSCTSECEVDCLDSGEVVDLSPYSFINPQYQLELKQLLRYSLAKNGIKTPNQAPIKNLEKQMTPQSIEEIEVLEKELHNALVELEQQKKKLQNKL